MVDSCRQLTGSQNNGDEDTAGMVTILTGHSVEEMTERSDPMKVYTILQFKFDFYCQATESQTNFLFDILLWLQAAVQAVGAAGMELKNITEFYKQWKEMG